MLVCVCLGAEGTCMYMQTLWKPEDIIRCYGAGVTGVCELLGSNSGPLQEQQGHLTADISSMPVWPFDF